MAAAVGAAGPRSPPPPPSPPPPSPALRPPLRPLGDGWSADGRSTASTARIEPAVGPPSAPLPGLPASGRSGSVGRDSGRFPPAAVDVSSLQRVWVPRVPCESGV